MHQNTLELLPLAQPVSIDPAVNSNQLLADNYHFAAREEMRASLGRRDLGSEIITFHVQYIANISLNIDADLVDEFRYFAKLKPGITVLIDD